MAKLDGTKVVVIRWFENTALGANAPDHLLASAVASTDPIPVAASQPGPAV